MVMKKKIIVGLIEPVKVIGKKIVSATAKIDTGAARSCIDETVAKEVGLNPVVKFVRVKSATTGGAPYIRRPVFKAKIEIAKRIIPVEVSIADRKHLKQKVLVGRDVIRSNFLVDVEHTHKTSKKR